MHRLPILPLASLLAVCVTGLSAQTSSTIPINVPPDQFAPSFRLLLDGTAESTEVVDFGTATSWVEVQTESTSAEIAWGFTAASDTTGVDSLACTSLSNDLAGKIALVRRGVCSFSDKAENAVAAGAVGVLICNNAADRPDEVITLGGPAEPILDLPVAMVSYAACERIAARIDAGSTVRATFDPLALSGGAAFVQNVTPIRQIDPGTPFVVDAQLYNLEDTDSVFTATLSVITPAGDTVGELQTVRDTIQPDEEELIRFHSVVYDFAAGIGTYTFRIAPSLPTAIPYDFPIAITEDYYQTFPATGAALELTGSTDAAFAEDGAITSHGMVIAVNAPTVAETFSFGICNLPELLDSASGRYPLINVEIYAFDVDGDGEVDAEGFDPGNQTLTQVFPNDENIIAYTEYDPTGDEECSGDLDEGNIAVPIRAADGSADSVVLVPGFYAVRVTVNSREFATPVAPLWLASSNDIQFRSLNLSDSFAVSRHFLSFEDGTSGTTFSGYGGSTLFSRLTVSGADPVVDVLDLPGLAGEFSLSPNPARRRAELRFSMDAAPSEGRVTVYDASGRRVFATRLPATATGTISIPTGGLTGGVYAVQVASAGRLKVLRLVVAEDR